MKDEVQDSYKESGCGWIAVVVLGLLISALLIAAVFQVIKGDPAYFSNLGLLLSSAL